MSSKELLTLEFRIPISPNEQFMRMLHYFLESLQAFAGEIGRNAHCVAVVGEDAEPWDLKEEYSWTKNYSIEFVWVERQLFCKDSYEATGYQRFWVESDADIIALVDADLLFSGDFDKVIIEAYKKQCVLGFIAHVSPFREPKIAETSSEEWWSKIFAAAGLPNPEFNWEYTGAGLFGPMSMNPIHTKCPAYFNYGVIIAPRVYVEQMGESFISEMQAIESVLKNNLFVSQMANTLTFARYNMPCEALSINYNFPLNVSGKKIRKINPDPHGKNSVDDIKIFHYLAGGEINKCHFKTRTLLNRILQRQNMSPEAKFFQQKLKIVNDRVEKMIDQDRNDNITDKQVVNSQEKDVLTSEYFICGGRRTGTTLLTAILSSDERTNPLGQEAQILMRLIQVYRWGRMNFNQVGSSFFDNLGQYKDFFQKTTMRFTEEVSARVSPGNILILKNPEFSHVLVDIAELYEDAALLATVRDPRDQVASEIEVEMRRLSDKGQDPQSVKREINVFAKRYMNYIRQIIDLYNNQPERIHVIRYEDLVLHPDNTIKHLSKITGLNLNFDPGREWPRVSKLAALNTTPSRSDLYGAPIETSSVGRYKKELSQEEVNLIEEICLTIMHEFDYKLSE